MTADRPRVPAGSPEGGEFAAVAGGEASLQLPCFDTTTDVDLIDSQVMGYFKHWDPVDNDGNDLTEEDILEELCEVVSPISPDIADYDALVRANYPRLKAEAAALVWEQQDVDEPDLFVAVCERAYVSHRANTLSQLGRGGLNLPCMGVADIEQDVAIDNFDGTRLTFTYDGLDLDGRAYDPEANLGARPAYTVNVFTADNWDTPIARVPTRIAADDPDANYGAMADALICDLPDIHGTRGLVLTIMKTHEYAQESLSTMSTRNVWSKSKLNDYVGAQNTIHDLRHELSPRRLTVAESDYTHTLVLEHLAAEDSDNKVRAAAAASLERRKA